MPYTNVWSSASPLGSAAANSLDSIVRTAKLDVEERLESFFNDIDTDPLQVKDGASTVGSFTVATDLAVTNGTATLNNTAAAETALALAISHASYVGNGIVSAITKAGAADFKHLYLTSGGLPVAYVDGLGAVVASYMRSGTTAHGSIANGNGAIPFLNATPAAGIWLITAVSTAGNVTQGMALYVSGGTTATTSITSLAAAAGTSWQLYAVDSHSPIYVNNTGGATTVVTSYIRLS
jgi:hypothetical protein